MTDPGWWEADVRCPDELKDDYCGLVLSEGLASGAETDRTGDLNRDGRSPDVVTFYFPEEVARDTIEAHLAEQGAALGAEVSLLRLDLNTDTSWKHRWKEFFKPLEVAPGIVVRPPWEGSPKHAEYDLVIDPGMAFGTGHHETTQACLKLMRDLPTSESLIDIGCGSGILAIYAAKRGYSTVVATDTDPPALEQSVANAALNAVESIQVRTPKDVEGNYDTVVANIIFNVLIDEAASILGRTKPGGTLLLSGIPEHAESATLEAYDAQSEPMGCVLKESNRVLVGEWLAIAFDVTTR